MVGLAVEDGESDPTGQIERERERRRDGRRRLGLVQIR
jgi:hypothetical protein